MIYTFIVRDSVNPNLIKKVISMNVVTGVNESWSANVLKTPVEKGFPITDHLSLNNGVFNIAGVISEYSIFDNNKELRWNGNYFESVGQNEDALKTLKNNLRSLILLGEVFSILISKETSLLTDPQQKYDELKKSEFEEIGTCCLANLSFEDQSGTSDVLNVQMSIEKIIVAVVQVDQVSQEERTKALRRNEVNAGTVTSSTSNITQTPAEAAVDKKTVEDEKLPESLTEVDKELEKNKEDLKMRQEMLKKFEQTNKEIEETGKWKPLPE